MVQKQDKREITERHRTRAHIAKRTAKNREKFLSLRLDKSAERAKK